MEISIIDREQCLLNILLLIRNAIKGDLFLREDWALFSKMDDPYYAYVPQIKLSKELHALNDVTWRGVKIRLQNDPTRYHG